MHSYCSCIIVRCSTCLKHFGMNKAGWRNCEKCEIDENPSFNNPIPYSTSVSVHSKPFVEFYSLVVLPKI